MNQRIKEVRRSLGLSQEEFGRRLGITKSAVSRIESSSNGASGQTVKSICREFNIEYGWLTTGQGEMFAENDDQVTKLVDTVLAGENEFGAGNFSRVRSIQHRGLAAASQPDKKIPRRDEPRRGKHVASK